VTDRLLRERGRTWTRNLRPGERVYGESLRRIGGHEYRDWAARRSKLAAYLEKGGRALTLRGAEHVLYLGAASGSTVSHLSDLLPQGRIVALEISPRPFRDLLHLAALRPNILPVLGDAHLPAAYAPLVDRAPDILVQDIAQRDQADLFARNAEQFLAPGRVGFLAIKARSINVAAPPKKVYDAVQKDLSEAGLVVRERVELDPFEKDHAMFVVTR
jgi:fibrillarin-like pre-rRNA processing protein